MTTRIDARTGLEVLDRDECLRLVASSPIGRLGVCIEETPLVFPVNFTLDNGAVVLRTNAGTKLYAARNSPVVFECDGYDPMYHTGWSVMISGRAEVVDAAADRMELDRLPLVPWCSDEKDVWLRIRPRTITGRRIVDHARSR